MVAVEGDTLGGGKEKVPSKPKSLISPTPTSFYGIVVLPTCWILPEEAGSDEK